MIYKSKKCTYLNISLFRYSREKIQGQGSKKPVFARLYGSWVKFHFNPLLFKFIEPNIAHLLLNHNFNCRFWNNYISFKPRFECTLLCKIFMLKLCKTIQKFTKAYFHQKSLANQVHSNHRIYRQFQAVTKPNSISISH